jgi:enamine deaminase RidA (YjgF/YER057c/UK114 family)
LKIVTFGVIQKEELKMKRIIQPSIMSKPGGDYSHGVLVKPGQLLFIAGQTAVGADGIIVGIGDPSAQAKKVYENIEAILSEAGGTFDDLVKLTTFITDISYREKVNEVRRRYLKKDFPASTLVVVKGLAREEFLVEVEAIACIEKLQ